MTATRLPLFSQVVDIDVQARVIEFYDDNSYSRYVPGDIPGVEKIFVEDAATFANYLSKLRSWLKNKPNPLERYMLWEVHGDDEKTTLLKYVRIFESRGIFRDAPFTRSYFQELNHEQRSI